MQNNKSNWFPHAMAMYNVIVWGTTFISTKVLLESLEPLEILIYRFVIGYIALWCLKPQFLKWQGLKKEFAYFIAGLFGVTIYFLGENISLTMTYTGNVSIIVSTAPLFTAICACIMTKTERPSKYFWGGFVLAIIGIAMIAVPYLLGTLEFVQELLDGAGFFCGLLNGIFAGLKIIGIVVLVYGIARRQK